MLPVTSICPHPTTHSCCSHYTEHSLYTTFYSTSSHQSPLLSSYTLLHIPVLNAVFYLPKQKQTESKDKREESPLVTVPFLLHSYRNAENINFPPRYILQHNKLPVTISLHLHSSTHSTQLPSLSNTRYANFTQHPLKPQALQTTKVL